MASTANPTLAVSLVKRAAQPRHSPSIHVCTPRLLHEQPWLKRHSERDVKIQVFPVNMAAASRKKQEATQRILLLTGDPLSDDGQQQPHFKLLQLPSPGTGQQAQYLLTSSGLLEVNRVTQTASSWLVQQAFVSDGSAYMATPVNIALVLLALLNSAGQPTGMFQEAESLLCCEAWPDAQQLLPLAEACLPCICDTKTPEGDALYYALNSSKVLAYLRVCAAQALAAFRSHSLSSIACLPEPEQQLYVLRFLKEYLSQPWADALASSYGISTASLSAPHDSVLTARPAAANTASGSSAEKKQRVQVDAKAAARKKAEEGRAAAAAAKLQKQAAGSKKISSFFSAKMKPPPAQ